jgi:hypothetical protein
MKTYDAVDDPAIAFSANVSVQRLIHRISIRAVSSLHGGAALRAKMPF